jgi:hypothetical protein
MRPNVATTTVDQVNIVQKALKVTYPTPKYTQEFLSQQLLEGTLPIHHRQLRVPCNTWHHSQPAAVAVRIFVMQHAFRHGGVNFPGQQPGLILHMSSTK